MAGQFISPEFGIPYEESAWQAQSVADSAHAASRRFQVDGDNAARLIQEVLGWTRFDAGGGGKLERHPPWTHPRFPWLNARSAQFVRELDPPNAHGPGGTLSYDVEEWEFSYASDEDRLVQWWPDNLRPQGVAGEAWRYCSRRFDMSMTIQQLTLGALRYNEPDAKGNNPVVPDGATGQLIPSRTLWITWYQIPVTLTAAGVVFPGRLMQTIDETVGHMNGTPFEVRAPQTLLCLDPKFVFKYMSNGEPAADITYTFAVRGGPDVSAIPLMAQQTATPDFTRIIRGPTGKYGRVYRKSDEPARVRSIYEPADFNRLFEFD